MPLKTRLGLILLTGPLLVAMLLAAATSLALPFQAGERLTFQISWGIIPAARVTLEVADPGEEGGGEAAYHFILNAHTLPVIAWLYPYQERIDSLAAAGVERSLLYKKVQESRHPRDQVVRFDWQQGLARLTNYGSPAEPIALQPGTLDPLAALYYIRAQSLGGEFNLEQWVTDGKKLSRGRARFIQRESLSIGGKTYQTVKIEPDMRDVSGVFEKSPGAKMFIWLTDDERKLLVKLQSKVVVGSFVAELLADESRLLIDPVPEPNSPPAVQGDSHE